MALSLRLNTVHTHSMKRGQLESIPGSGTVLTDVSKPEVSCQKSEGCTSVFLLVIQGLCVYLRKLGE